MKDDVKTSKWQAAALGNAEGWLEYDGQKIALKGDAPAQQLEISGPCILHCDHGKLGDSEDSFLFLCTSFDPRQENIRLEAELQIREDRRHGSWQSGCGLYAVDTLSAGNKRARYRNSIGCGTHRCRDFKKRSSGLRIVCGYRDPAALDRSGRILDTSREFSEELLSQTERADSIFLSLTKDSEGFRGTLQQEELFVRGCDLLTAQDAGKIYIGIAVSGGLEAEVKQLQLQRTTGEFSTSEGEILRTTLPDYPFSRRDLPEEPENRRLFSGCVYVSPLGSPAGKGTVEDPQELSHVLQNAGEDLEVRLQDGVYQPTMPYIAASHGRGTAICKACHPRQAVLDGSLLQKEVPLFLLKGEDWRIEGICFRNAPSSGLFICGSRNTVHNCEASRNKDSGILICAHPGAEKEAWPAGNTVEYCDSHHNQDDLCDNADGFGAKLRVGEGNRFRQCLAYRNCDDGFDLFNKSIIGSSAAVTLEQCIAYGNGTDRTKNSGKKGSGVGFKLGGEGVAVPHQAVDCIAFANASHDFSSNNNPAAVFVRCKLLTRKRLFNKMQLREAAEGIRIEHSRRMTPLRRQDGSLYLAEKAEDKAPVTLFIVPRLFGGGAEKALAALASEFSADREVYLLSLGPTVKNEQYPVGEKVRILDLSESWKKYPSWSRGLLRRSLLIRTHVLKRLKKELKIERSVSFLNTANFLNAFSKAGDKTIISVRSCPEGAFAQPEYTSLIGRALIRAACRKADSVVAVSRGTALSLERLGLCPPEKLFSIPNYCDEENIRLRSQQETKEDELLKRMKEASFVFVSAGRLVRKKGQWHLIRAFREVLKEHPEALLVILGRKGGSTDATPLLEKTIRENGLEKNVLLPGHRQDPFVYERNADAFVMTSFNEGFPNVLVEAMALGLPCISTDCDSGPREILAPDTEVTKKATDAEYAEHGILVPECSGISEPVGRETEKEERILAEAMMQLIGDEHLRAHYAEKAREGAKKLDKETILAEWHRCIDE